MLLPGGAGYEEARRPAIARFEDIAPRALVRCSRADDVAAALALARSEGFPVPRSGAAATASPERSSTDGVVIDVSPMNSVSLDGEVASLGAGAQLGDVYDALAAQGRTIAAGCGPEVGIAGLALGGGLGILGRSHGLTADQLLGASVVLADGRIVEAGEQREPDLFWALRGAGGGQFGAVTSLSLRTLPAPEVTTALQLSWPDAHAAAVVRPGRSGSPAPRMGWRRACCSAPPRIPPGPRP